MKKALVVITLFITWNSFGDDQLCKIKKAEKEIYKVSDKNLHVYFTRCHPTLPLAFSNQSLLDDNKMEYLNPAMINMKTGKVTQFKIPKGYTAEDMVPTPDGKFLLVDLSNSEMKNAHNLGMYSLDNGTIVQKSLINVKDFTDYSYPSPAIRDGKYMILARRYSPEDKKRKPFLDIIDEKNNVLKEGVELCPELSLRSDIHLDRPYVSPDGTFFANAINNTMTIMKINWAKISADNRSVPCEKVAELTQSAGKVSFSPDNKKIVFHAAPKDYLGNNTVEEYFTQSFMMDLTTGETVPLTEVEKDKRSEFPYFCGNQGIIVREAYDNGEQSVFKLLPVPKIKSTLNLECEENSDAPIKLANFWEGVCRALNPSLLAPTFDIQVTPKNCDELIEKWRNRKNISTWFKESELRAACDASFKAN
jgi:hypothetical protein